MTKCPNCGRQYLPKRPGQVFCTELCKDRWCARRAKHRASVARNEWRTR